jgi:hypothetical protein
MMKLPTIVKIRIPILLALAIGEAVGLLHFYGQPKFFQFIVLSLAGIMLIVPLLWLDFMRRLEVPYSALILIPAAFLGIASSWKHGDDAFAVMWVVLLLVDITIILNSISKALTDHGGRA